MQIGIIDYSIIAVYFVFVLGIGYALKKNMKSTEDFFLSGRSIPSWITGLAFISANLGAIEVMGMAAQGAEYGIQTVHFYWVGAIPAMLFLAIFMMPFYYSSKIHSVPEYLKLRFNEPTRAFNAISFAVMTVLMSGINMYAMAIVFKLLLNWDMTASIVVSAAVVLAYTMLGGLTSSIYNEVLQFFLIVLGLLPLTLLGLNNVGGWEGLTHQISSLPKAGDGFIHVWKNMGGYNNPMGIDWFGMVMGLGFVGSFGYWCTDFLVVQRALAAENMNAAQRTPLIAAFPKMFFPLLTVVPGMLALVLVPQLGSNLDDLSYNQALPLMLSKFYPTGMLGIGLTAMLASFMSGMAGNITAFNTVWTYDIYKSYIAKDKSDEHYLRVGRIATAVGIIVSIATAFFVMGYKSIMDYMQAIFSFFNAPLFATFLLGVFWKRATPWAAFWGLVGGTFISMGMYVAELMHQINFPSPMAGNFWRYTIAWATCFVLTIALSYVTKPKSPEELKGLVWGTLPKFDQSGIPLWKRPVPISIVLLVLLVVVDVVYW